MLQNEALRQDPMETTTADPVSARINPPKNDMPDLHRAVAGFCLHQEGVSSSAFHSTLAILWLRRGARKCTWPFSMASRYSYQL